MAKIIAPVVTIFNEEEKPDYAGNKKVIDFLIEGGLDGILVLGSAGEFPDLNEQERLDFFRFYAEYVNGRVELLAGTGWSQQIQGNLSMLAGSGIFVFLNYFGQRFFAFRSR